MEFRWLTTEEKRSRSVEIGSLPEVLALAQKLQAEGGGLVAEDEVVEMGRELGVRPEYIREALRLRQGATQPAATTPRARNDVRNDAQWEASPTGRVVQAALLGLGLGTLPLALI